MGYETGRGELQKPHIRFVEIDDTGLTKKWAVENIHSNDHLAIIKWHGAWRKYALFPAKDTVWDNNCMTTVMEFMSKEMQKRKEMKK